MSKHPEEGIAVSYSNDGLQATITRIDTTNIRFIQKSSHLAKAIEKHDRLFVIDEAVFNAHRQLLHPLTEKYPHIIFNSAEKEKNWENLRKVIDAAVGKQISRSGALVAIGGGVLTDMVGLAANLYFRGISTVLVPTTLLAMVDAAIGGKVAVNHPHQKNMMGSFYHPTEVLISVEFLKTLEKRHLLAAAGEILKLAILSPTDLFAMLEEAPPEWHENEEFLDKVVRTCVFEKLRMLGANCFERDLRRVLNLGHTVAHPLEDVSDFKILHGEAVAFGVLVASHIAKQRNLLSLPEFNRILLIAKRLGLSVPSVLYDHQELWSRIRRLVQQRGGSGLLYVLPTAIGSAIVVQDISHDEFLRAYAALTASELA